MAHRLAILTTHPIQYHAPWFRALSAHPQLELEVLYCHRATPREQAAAGFGFEFDWDVSLLDGYPHRFLKNAAAEPTINSFHGLDTPDIKRVVEQEQFDAVLINGWHYKSAWQAMRACWNTGTPVMVRSDSHLRTARSNAKQMAKWPLYRWFIPKLDACLPVGQWSRDYFLHYGASPQKIFIIPHVIDDVYFSNESERLRPERDQIRSDWGLSPHQTVFLFAGKFVEKKRPMDFLRGIKRAGERDSKIAGLLVGDGPLKTQCEEFVTEENLPVHFTGFLNQSEIVKAYVAADALVLPSDGGETWGLVVNEAMACGLPCFISDQVGCGPDMVAGHNNGGIFRLADIEHMTELLSEFARNKGARADLSQKARSKAASSSIGATVEATAAVLEYVSARRRSPR
jgi:glycosyltransferase involved in cell wall biosynthesis